MFSKNQLPGLTKLNIRLRNNVFYILIVCYAFVQNASSSSSCRIKWGSSLPVWYPLVFNNAGIIYPHRTGNNSDWSLLIEHNGDFNISCTTAGDFHGYNVSDLKVHCHGATHKTIVNKKPVDFSKLGCKKHLQEKLVAVGKCYNQSTSVDILFQAKYKRLPLINICHNENLDDTIFAHHFIEGSALNKFEVSNKRPTFKEGIFYTKITANNAYKQTSQLKQVESLVCSESLAKKYIDKKRSFYFARGHLAPDGDFVHVYEQNATYFYINVSPQWQSINNGNWKALEFAVRTYAKDRNAKLEVWTGGKNVLKLEDVNGNPVEIYLSKEHKGKLVLPVPEILWKVVHDLARNASVAVFMINNPHLTEVPSSLTHCSCVCPQISWVTWDIKNIIKGYTYCCEIDSVKKLLPFLPEIKSGQLLT
ncbi:Nuclease EXOG, mitochondrial [Orchesella cincta]|uniref:Nuclease EXOG, mitochondrial n=1 Tax=Orchesella cincta TaxID=48709 RepID=A0A1D2MPB8_ORCCI|nr:Nuclease EXOG, mitochondrial [Orchesella cincta]